MFLPAGSRRPTWTTKAWRRPRPEITLISAPGSRKAPSKKAKENFIKDLDATLKDSLKSIDAGVKEESFEANGVKMSMMKGSGVDKRAGNKVKFQVAMFSAGADKIGIVYIDYDNDAPKDTMDAIQGIMKSIKVAAKK